MADLSKTIDGIKRLRFFNQRAGRELWGDKPHDVQEQDIASADMVYADAIELLKEQEIGHWVALENCSNAGVYCSECRTKIFDHYPIKKKLSYFCPHCGTRMEGEIERR